MNLYSTVLDYVRSATGVEVSSLVGSTFWLNQPVGASASQLPISPALQVALNLYDRVMIFDGPQSEIVTVGGSAPIGQSTLTLLGTTSFAHSANVVCCTDGVSGSLMDALVSASTLLENICNQSLYKQSYTGEILRMPSMRASLDNGGMLTLRPKHFPLVSLDSIQVARTHADATSYDASQAFLDADMQTLALPLLSSSGGSPFVSRSVLGRGQSAFATIGYTAGYTMQQLPADVKDACILLTSDVLMRRSNPGGWSSLTQGKTTIVGSARGDTSGDSILYKQAVSRLNSYSMKVL